MKKAKNGLPQQTEIERKFNQELNEEIVIKHDRNKKDDKPMSLSEIARENKRILDWLDKTATVVEPVHDEHYEQLVKEADERIEKARQERFEAEIRSQFYPADNEIPFKKMVLKSK